MIWFIIISLVWHILRVNADCVYPDLGTQIAYLEPYRLDGYNNFETVYIYCNETIPYVAQASICLFGTWGPEFPTEICNDPCQVPVADGMTYSRLAGQTDGVIFTHGSRISFTCERGDPGPTTSTCNDGVWEPPVLCPETSTTYLTTLFVSPAQPSTNGRTGGTELLTTQPQPSITSGAPISHSTVDHFTTTERAGTDDISTKSLLTSTPATTAFDIFTTLSISSESIVDQQTTELQPSITSDAPISYSTVDLSTTTTDTNTDHTSDGFTSKQITSIPSSGTNEIISNSPMEAVSTLSPVTDGTETDSASTERAGTDDISTKPLLTSTAATTYSDSFTTSFISSGSIVEQQTTELQPSITSDAPISYSTVDLSTTTTDTNTDHTLDGFTSKQITSIPSSGTNEIISNSPMEAVSTLSPVTDGTETNSASTEQTGTDDISTKPLLTSTAATTYSDSFTTSFISSGSIVEQQTTELQPSITSDAPISYSTVDLSTTTTDTNTDHTLDGFTSKQKTSIPSSWTNEIISNSPMEAVSTLSPVTDGTDTNSASTEQTGTDDISTKPLLISTAATTALDSFTTPSISSESTVEQKTTGPTESLTPPTKYSTTTNADPSSAPTIGNTVDGASDQPKVTSETVAATKKTPYMLHTVTMQRYTATMPTDGSTSDISHQGTASASGEPTSHVLDNTFSTTGTLHTSLGTLSSVATSVATSFESITTETVKEEASSDSYHTGRSVATSQYDTSTGTDYFRETSNNLGTFVTLHQSIGTTCLLNTYSPKPFLASSDPTFETSTTIGQPSPEVPTEDATTLEIDRPTLGITEGATTTPAEETKWSTTIKRATTDQRATTQGPGTSTMCS
ncbi:mucin-3A [Strongylocentrotus purpuratus]|uniref:Sushi domain-containing protein n=1 Tax=Strongylocentrotus purpuratus TaxID=7668 RepID=A0A7M7NZW4_STRPU|nr:mucin-3A [Strongylocentrotus purpuratus]